MIEQTKLFPKKRFKDFQNNPAWEEHKIGDFADVLTGGTPKTHLKEYWNPKEIPWMSSGEVSKKRLTSTDNMISSKGFENSSARLVKKNSILIALAGQGKTRGTVAINEIPLTTNQSIAAIVPNNELYHEFLYQNLEKRYEELRLISSGDGTRGGLNKKLVSNLIVMLPKPEEQIKIGDFLKQIDFRINLLQRKLEKTKALKSAYLSEMFPAKGESVPKRRFAGFTQDWQVKKLGELTGNFEYGLNASAILFDGINKYIRITDIDDQTRVFNQIALTSPDANLSNAEDYILKKGDILFARTGASVGKTYRYRESDGKVYYAGFLIRARIDSQFDSEFVFQNTLTKQYNNFVRITSQRSGQPGINAQEYSQFNLMVPALDEQRKIGNFFKQLDDIITHHQSKLDKLQNLKKAYLHEMFV